VNVQLRHLVVAVALAITAPPAVRAQDTGKPGGLNKVARNVSKTVKKAGRDTKAEVKRDAGKTHHALKQAGNETKTTLKKTTGIKGSQSKQPGGLNKVAREASATSKHAARHAKAEKNKAKSKTHAALTETGKSIKDTTLKGKP
jgi:hypothetical protein